MAKLDTLTLRARFVTSAPTGITILYPNAPAAEPDPTKAFIRWSLGPAESKRTSFGERKREDTIGRVYMGVFVPKGSGDALALDLAEQCAAIYRNWRWSNGENTLFCDTPATQTFDNEAAWFQVRVSVPWSSVHYY